MRLCLSARTPLFLFFPDNTTVAVLKQRVSGALGRADCYAHAVWFASGVQLYYNESMMRELTMIGWREWVGLPELGIPYVKAKIDTGARTSALHAYFVEPYVSGGLRMVRFGIHPIQRNEELSVVCTAPVKDVRVVSDSGGHKEERQVIETSVRLGESLWRIELTLTNRDQMLFRMLLGRTAMRRRLFVNPGKSFLQGQEPDDPRFFGCTGDEE